MRTSSSKLTNASYPGLQARAGVYAVVSDKNGRIALLLRANTGFADGRYSLPSGHVDGGEPLVQAMRRELIEELGIDVSTKELQLVHVLHRRKPTNIEHVDFFFLCTKWLGEVRNREPHKHANVTWASPNALPDNFLDYHLHGLRESLAGNLLSYWGWD